MPEATPHTGGSYRSSCPVRACASDSQAAWGQGEPAGCNVATLQWGTADGAYQVVLRQF